MNKQVVQCSADLRSPMLWVWLVALWILASIFLAQAQSANIEWLSLDGGGGKSTSAVYVASFSIGQPIAGVFSGGNYSAAAGFWSVAAAAQEAARPTLVFEQNRDRLTLVWSKTATDYFLDETESLAGPINTRWSEISTPYQSNSTHFFFEVPSPVTKRFYRLRRPVAE
jgi:hypothetical protein